MNHYQKNILNTEYCFPNTAVANIGGILRIAVDINYNDSSSIVREVVRKTTSLRLRLNWQGELYEYPKEHYDMKYSKIHGRYQDAFGYAQSQMSVPFASIYDCDLFQFEYIEYDEGCAIFLKLHHLLGDAASVSLICKKVDDGYRSLQKGETYQCDDTAVVYQEASKADLQEAACYFEEKQIALQPPCIGERETKGCHAERMQFELPFYQKRMTAEFLLALYIYVSSITNSSRVAFGLVFGNRSKKEMEMFGMFANTLPLVLELPDGSYDDLCKQVKREIMQLMRYSRCSLDAIREETQITHGLFEISVSYRYKEFVPKMTMGEVEECFNGCVDVPMRINIEEQKEKIIFDITYKTEVFAKEYIRNMGESLQTILCQGRDNPLISQIDFLTKKDNRIYQQLNHTQVRPVYQDVIECFRKHVSHGEALVWEDGSIDGYELAARGCAIAGYIEKKKAKIVGIHMERSHEMIECVIGTLMAGAAFLILSDVIGGMEQYCDLVIYKEDVKEVYSQTKKRQKDFAGQKDFASQHIRSYDPDSTAYLICTSGTTGGRKCIEISRGSLMSRLEWADRVYGLQGTILQKTVNTFDVSVWEMLSVVFGARLCLLKEGEEKLPDKIVHSMMRYEIEKLHFVPSVLQRFLHYVKLNYYQFPCLKEVYVSGEKLEKATAEEFFDILPGVRLINYYGPAECTIDVTSYECIPGELPDEVPIGRPADNTQIVILNKKDQIMPVGVAGEICILGKLVGKGYLGIEHENFCMLGGHRAYKTGDIGKIGFDGNLYIYGRNDQQVKLRGMRVNLSEIKNRILQYDGIQDAEIIKCNNRLECYYCGDVDIDKMRQFLVEKLPAYAIPSIYQRLDHLPLNANGKVDKKILVVMSEQQNKLNQKEAAGQKPDLLSGLEQVIWSEVSRFIPAHRQDNLFDLGLDSVSVLDVVCRLQEKGYPVTFSDFYENLTIEHIAENMNQKQCYTYLRKSNADDVIICFPYAGGEPQNFSQFASKVSCDVIGVYMSSFSAESTLEEVAKTLVDVLPFRKYKRVYLYGQCIGCMLAFEFASGLPEPAAGMILTAPSWRTETPGSSPWKRMPDRCIMRILRMSGAKQQYTKDVLEGFRKDTERFFAYCVQKKNHHPFSNRVCVIFGTKDIFTWNASRILSRIQKSFSEKLVCDFVKGGDHFMNETQCEKLCETMKKYYPELF